MKTTALIISLNFRAAHVSHLVASYKQMEELGYNSILLITKECVEFLPAGIEYVLSLKEVKAVDIAIFWFPAIGNIKAMWKLRHKFHAKIIYVFHEPIEKFSSYRKSGNSMLWTIKFFMKYYVGLVFLLLSNKVLLPSAKAISLYQKGVSRVINRNYSYLPLMYPDEREDPVAIQNRKYISYIGGISKDHAFDEFVDFIYKIYINRTFDKQVKFLIASWRKAPDDHKIFEMQSVGVLDVYDGKPLTNKEINSYYAASWVVWNAYNRSTQSGVLAKSFMFGTPGLVMRKNLSEFVRDGREVKAIDDNTSVDQLTEAVKEILANFSDYSQAARENYERNYDYRCHNESMVKILNSL